MLLIDQLKQPHLFSNSEQIVADYILTHPHDVIYMDIKTLAEKTYSSNATITRICKKVNVRNFPDFKIKLAQEFNTFVVDKKRVDTNIPFPPGLQSKELSEILFKLHYQSLTDTFQHLSYKKIERMVSLINQSQELLLIGQGASLLIVEDLYYKLLRIGYPVKMTNELGFQIPIIRTCQNATALIISHGANSYDIYEQMYNLKQHNIKTILICANEESPIIPHADISLIIDNDEKFRKIGSFASRTSLHYICDLLFCLIFEKNYIEYMNTINKEKDSILDETKLFQYILSQNK